MPSAPVMTRGAAVRRRIFHERWAQMNPRHGDAEAGWDEVRPLLDEELDRLPEKYRAPLVLCYLEGQTHEEAARASAVYREILEHGTLERVFSEDAA